MAGNRVVKVEVLGDAKSLAQAFGSAGKAADGFGSKIADIGKIAAGFVVGQGLMKLPGLFSDAVSAGSNLNESLNAVNQIFGDSAQAILNWGENNATSFGLSQRAFNDLAVPLGAGLKNAGLSMDDVSQHTINLTERAADMASVFNTDVDEALAAIQAGLRGEADPLERFGVGLSAAAVEAEAMAMTGKTVAGSLTDQEKALARVNLIMKQTEDVAGDFTNTSDGAANSARIAAAKQEELAAAIGQKLLPVQQALNQAKLAFLSIIADKVLPVLTVLAARLEGPLRTAFGLVRDGVLTFVQALQGDWSDNENIHGLHRVIGNVGLVIREQVIPAVQSLASWFTETALPAIQNFATLAAGFVTGTLIPAFQQIASAVLPALQQFSDWFTGTALPTIQNFATTVFGIITETIIPAFQSFLSTIQPGLQALLDFLDGNLKYVFVGVGAVIVAGFTAWAIAAGAAAVATIAALAPLVATVAGIGIAAAALYAAWDTNFLGIQDVTHRVIDWFSTYVPPVLDGAWSAIRTGLDGVMSAWNSAWPAIQSVVETVMPIVAQIAKTYIGILKSEIELAIGAVKWAFDNVFVPVQGIVSDVFNTISGLITTVWGPSVEAIRTGVQAAKTAYDEGFVPIQGVVSDVFNTIADIVATVWNGAEGAVAKIGAGLETAKGFFTGVYDTFHGFGSSITSGLSAGIGPIVETIRGIVDGILKQWERIPAFLRPGSPSKWAREQGKSVVDGLVIELESGIPRIAQAVNEINATLGMIGHPLNQPGMTASPPLGGPGSGWAPYQPTPGMTASPPLTQPVVSEDPPAWAISEDPPSYIAPGGSFANPQNVGGGKNFGAGAPIPGTIGAGAVPGVPGGGGNYATPNSGGGIPFDQAYDPNSPMQTPFHVARRQGVRTWAEFAQWVASMQAKGYVQLVNGQPQFTNRYYTEVLGWIEHNGTLYNVSSPAQAAQLNALKGGQGGSGAAQTKSIAQAVEEGYVNGARRILNGSRPSTQLVGA